MKLYESTSTSLTKHGKILAGLFAECGKKNQNGRIYPESVYIPALNGILPKIREGRLLGELDHPSDRDEVCLSNVSHVIKECRVDGNKIYGTIELLDTPAGKIAQALNEAGIPLCISSRGVGNTRRVNEGEEVTDFTLITYDLVADPSFSNAILSESAKIKLKYQLDDVACNLPLNESVGDSSGIRSKIDSIKQSIDEAPSVTSKLVESIGSLTEDNQKLLESNEKLKKDISEANKRNESLSENMRKLQDTYNLISESAETLQSKADKTIKDLDESYKSKLRSVRESYNSKLRSVRESYGSQIDGLNEEIVSLRKQLAIEKRGLSSDKIMPMLEGLTTENDIEDKLNSIKNLGTRRYISTANETHLTEGVVSKPKSKLSSIISSV